MMLLVTDLSGSVCHTECYCLMLVMFAIPGKLAMLALNDIAVSFV